MEGMKIFKTTCFMKKIYLFVCAVFTVALFSISCNKEQEGKDSVSGYCYTFSIIEEGKATLDNNGVSWEDKDRVGMFLNGYIGYANVDITTDPKTLALYSTEVIPVGSIAYAYYPYSAENDDKEETKISIPNIQEGYTHSAMPMAGIPFTVEEEIAAQNKDGNGKVYFLNLGSIIDFKVFSSDYAGETLEYITFSAPNSAVSGDGYIDLTGVEENNESSLELTFGLGDEYDYAKVHNIHASVASDKAQASSVYLVVAPGTYSGTITIGTDQATYIFPFSNKTLARNELKHYNMNLANATRGDKVVEIKTLPYSQDFTSSLGDFSTDGVKVNNTDVWTQSGSYGVKATAYIGDNNYESESWLTSPVIDLTGVEGATLTFEQCVNKFLVAGAGTVMVKEYGSDSWDEITITYPSCGNGTWSAFAPKRIDLENYVGKKIIIAFKYVSTSDMAGTWEIKNFLVEETLEKSFMWDLSIDETVSASTTSLNWNYRGVTMAAAKGSSSTNANNYYPGTSGHNYTSTRFYKNSTLTITPYSGCSITRVEFLATTSGYATALCNSTWSNAIASMEEGNDDKLVTVTPENGSIAFSAEIAANCGFTSVTVYYTGDLESLGSKSITFSQPTGAAATAGCSFTVSVGGSPIATGDEVESGETVTLTATAGDGYEFTSWTVEGAIVADASAGTTTFVMGSSDVSISAIFTQIVANTVTFAQSSGGSFTVSVDNENIQTGASVQQGKTVTLTATANSGYSFSSWTVSGATVSGNTPTATFTMGADPVTVTATFEEGMVDILTREFTGISGTSYGDWTGSGSVSDAIYVGNSAGGNNSIQLRASNNSGLVTTISGGYVKKIKVIWEQEATQNGRTLNVYGKNSAYTEVSDLYDDNAGDLIGTIVMGTSTEFSVPYDYQYIGLRSDANTLYLTEIQIIWSETASGHTPPVPTYAVNWTEPSQEGCSISASVNGNAISSGDEFEAGTEVSISASAGTNYTFGGWTVTGANVANASAATTTFTMGSSDVNISASFEFNSTATSYVYVFTDKNWGATRNNVAENWTMGTAGYSYQSGRGIQITSGASGANGTSLFGFTNIEQIIVEYSTNASSGAGSIAVQVGSGTAKSQTVSTTGGTSDRVLTYDYLTKETGKVKVTVTCTTNSIFVKSVTIKAADIILPASYNITCATISNGSVSADKATAYEGETVTLTATPNSGYQFSSWDVYKTGESSTKVTVSNNSFTMPAYDVTVSAVFTYNASMSYTLDKDDFTTDVQSYASSEATITASDGSKWKINGYGATANTSFVIGKGGANYITTPNCPSKITSIVVTVKGNTSYYLTVKTSDGDTELLSHQYTNGNNFYEHTFDLSSYSFTQVRLVSRRASGTSNAAGTFESVTVNY